MQDLESQRGEGVIYNQTFTLMWQVPYPSSPLEAFVTSGYTYFVQVHCSTTSSGSTKNHYLQPNHHQQFTPDMSLCQVVTVQMYISLSLYNIIYVNRHDNIHTILGMQSMSYLVPTAVPFDR